MTSVSGSSARVRDAPADRVNGGKKQLTGISAASGPHDPEARVIELRNIDRDKYFRIDTDVYIDGEPLLPKINKQYLTGGK